MKCWIKGNWEIFFDEIDFDFIEIIISYMEDVLCEVYILCKDWSKGRKEKVKIFLEFVLKKDDYVLVL